MTFCFLPAGGSRLAAKAFLQRLIVDSQRVGGSEIPYRPAMSAAASHRESGMRPCPFRVARHRSNRRRTPSSRAGRSPRLVVSIGCPPQVCELTAHDTIPLKTIHTRLPQGHEQIRQVEANPGNEESKSAAFETVLKEPILQLIIPMHEQNVVLDKQLDYSMMQGRPPWQYELVKPEGGRMGGSGGFGSICDEIGDTGLLSVMGARKTGHVRAR